MRKYFPLYEEAVSHLQLLHSELPYIWGKFDFLFYQCMSFRSQRAHRMLRFTDRLRERDSSHRRLSPPGGGTGLLSGPRRSAHRRPLAAEPGAGPASHGGPQRLADGGPGLDGPGRWLWFWKRWDEVFFFLFKKLSVSNFPLSTFPNSLI